MSSTASIHIIIILVLVGLPRPVDYHFWWLVFDRAGLINDLKTDIRRIDLGPESKPKEHFFLGICLKGIVESPLIMFVTWWSAEKTQWTMYRLNGNGWFIGTMYIVTRIGGNMEHCPMEGCIYYFQLYKTWAWRWRNEDWVLTPP